MKIKITHLFPDLLNLYGDSGNIETLRHRLLWRGIDVEVTEHTKDMADLDLGDTDILFIGGGGDAEERIVASRLCEYRDSIKEFVDANKTVLAVCGGFPLLGRYYTEGDEKIEGAGVLDIYTEPSDKRFIGDTIIKLDIIKSTVVGFTNHGGRTYINGHTPLGETVVGFGNNGEDIAEGVVYKNVFATYLHGPLLPKNAKLCDYILEKTLREKYYEFKHLEPLESDLEDMAHKFILDRYGDK